MTRCRTWSPTMAGSSVLMFNNYVNAHDGKVQHGPLAANYDVDGLKVTKRWWFG